MFGAFQTFGKLGAIGKAIAAAWSPLALWPLGAASPGMWIDPSLLTASFNDSTGTTPVATPGSVADSANPVGLALDIRAGAPETLGPELVVNGGFDTDTAWSKSAGVTISGGTANWTAASSAAIYQGVGTVGSFVEITFTVISCSSGGFSATGNSTVGPVRSTPGTYSDRVMVIGGPNVGVFSAASTTGSIDNISVREIPGLHLSQSTSAARPVASARVNLLTKTETLEAPYWAFTNIARSTSTSVPDSRFTSSALVVPTAVASIHRFTQSIVSVASCTVRLRVKASGYERILVEDGQYGYFWFAVSLATGTVLTQTGCTVTVSALTDGWYLITATCPLLRSSGAFTCSVFPEALAPAQFGGPSYTGDGTSGMLITGFELVPTSLANLGYQRVGAASDYTATGFPAYLKFDGVDDALSSATFAAGTLTSSMDCLIAVRRDSTANAVCGLYNAVADATKFFGMAESGSGSGCVGSGAGTPTVWVDGTQLTGGTAVTRGTLHTALTAGAWHIIELRGLDLSTWTAAGFGKYTSYILNGARGDIMLYPSTASTEDKDAARQYLADKYGVTLP